MKNNLAEFDAVFTETLKDKNNVINSIGDYLLLCRGKQMRPLLLLLVAGMHGDVNHKSYISSVLIELTHTSSLIHDDIVDEAFQRRGRLSVNAIWRSKNAVLVGDYILSKAIRIAVENKLFEAIGIMSEVMEDMSSGEIMQMELSQRLELSRDKYFEVIRSKTARLLGACSYLGALSVDAVKEDADRMNLFGVLLGTAFQIKDDILDYSQDGKSGKAAYNDIRERKITLPLITSLENVGENEKREILSIMRDSDMTGKKISLIGEFVKNNDGVEKASKEMSAIVDNAIKLLDCYPDSKYKNSLVGFANYVLEREK